MQTSAEMLLVMGFDEDLIAAIAYRDARQNQCLTLRPSASVRAAQSAKQLPKASRASATTVLERYRTRAKRAAHAAAPHS